ncbi:hypothetical protein ACFL4L_04315, partial [bacterium]
LLNIVGNGRVGIGTTAPAELLEVSGAVRLGSTSNTNTGTIRWTGSDFEGYNGSGWQSFTGGGSGSGWTVDADTVSLTTDTDLVGIGTDSPEFKLSLTNDGGILAEGEFHSGRTLTKSGAGARLIWYPRQAAFRAGDVGDDVWDAANIGDCSVAMGFGTKASGYTSIAMGYRSVADNHRAIALGDESTASAQNSVAIGLLTEATGEASTAIGTYADATGQYSTAIGVQAKASGDRSISLGEWADAAGDNSTAMGYFTYAGAPYSTAMGYFTVASGMNATALGDSTRADSYTSVAIGRYNVGGGSSYTWNYYDPLFEIGIGTGDMERANALTVLKYGYVGIGTATPTEPLEVNGGIKASGLSVTGGIVTSNLRVTDSPVTGYVLTADASGNATWQPDATYGTGWKLVGNAGTTPGTYFVGTTDNQALEMKVNSARAMRLEPHATSPNIIGGHQENSVTSAIYGATISGGGASGSANSVSGSYGTVPGGLSNSAQGDYSFAAGRRAKALNDGSFVWADATDSDFSSVLDNEFRIGASNGLTVISSNDSYAGCFDNQNGDGDGVFVITDVSKGPSWGALSAFNIGTSPAIYASAALAGYFSGNVTVTGTVSKGGGSFKIDHPLDPENMYLYHSFVESPDMKNVYDGVIELDSKGEAWVALPDYFEALNRDFRYQLTCIGGYAQVYIAEKINDNRFRIGGGNPGMEVSWQVTGIRQDAFANANRIPVEEEKNRDEVGRYLHPEAFGFSNVMSVDYDNKMKRK